MTNIKNASLKNKKAFGGGEKLDKLGQAVKTGVYWVTLGVLYTVHIAADGTRKIINLGRAAGHAFSKRVRKLSSSAHSYIFKKT